MQEALILNPMIRAFLFLRPAPSSDDSTRDLLAQSWEKKVTPG